LKITTYLPLLFLLFIASSISAQSVSGEWYGVGRVKKAGDHSSYLSELIIQQKGNKITGEFNYFFRSVEMKTRISGTYNPKYRLLELTAKPILNFQAKDENGADCPMEGSFTLKVSRLETTLTGQFNPIYAYRFTCPAINIKFVKSVPQKSTPVPKEEEEEEIVSVPETKEPVTTAKADTTPGSTIISQPAVPATVTAEQQITNELKQRLFEVSPVIEVDADSLKVTLYDNGEVDNDTISVFYNRKLIARKQMLSAKPIELTLALDTSINEISMFAENLGTIPPNTALAIIYAGEQRFELNLTSTYNKNAKIRFKKKVKPVDPKNVN